MLFTSGSARASTEGRAGATSLLLDCCCIRVDGRATRCAVADPRRSRACGLAAVDKACMVQVMEAKN